MVAVLLAVGTPNIASAHGKLKSSSPGSGAHLSAVPRELRLEFTEVPDLTFSKVALLGPDQRAIALGPLRYATDSKRVLIADITATLTSGRYVVRWQLAGDDGHPIRGQFDFVVAPGAMAMAIGGARSSDSAGLPPKFDSTATAAHHDAASMPEGDGFGAESVGYVAVRWLQFVALVLLIGSVAFRQFVLTFLRRGDGADSPMLVVAENRVARLGYVVTWALVVTLVLRLFAQSYAMHGAAEVWDLGVSAQMIRKTVWGTGWLLQLVGVFVAGVGFHLVNRRRSEPDLAGSSHRSRFAWQLATLGAVVVAFSLAFSGHAAASPRLRALAVLADGVHVLGAGSWLGTLAVVLLVGIPSALRLAAPQRAPMIARMINAFSPLALSSAAIAATTGVFAAWLHVGRIPNLWSTQYGVTLLWKLVVLGMVSVTGFYNWRFVKPRLGTDGATVLLRRSTRVEVAVAALVLVITAVLVATPTSLDMRM